jgi:hypothetical protein
VGKPQFRFPLLQVFTGIPDYPAVVFTMVILKHAQALYHIYECSYCRSGFVRLWGILSSVRYTLYCICGVEELPKVTFMPINSFNVNISRRVIGAVQGTPYPLVESSMSCQYNFRFFLVKPGDV